jgi:ferredoxin-NADP reductase
MRVSEVISEAPGIVSLIVTGRHLDRLHVKPGQFFIWRFLARGFWWTAHPFSLSQAADGKTLRITVKALGDHSAKLARLKPGTPVVVEGPFGAFTEEARTRPKALFIGGGIGITPVRALIEKTNADAVVLYRVVNSADVVFADELDRLEQERGIKIHYVVGDHAAAGGERLLSPEHLRELVPDLDDREVYLCGPPAMVDAVDRNLHAAGISRRHLHVERFAI